MKPVAVFIRQSLFLVCFCSGIFYFFCSFLAPIYLILHFRIVLDFELEFDGFWVFLLLFSQFVLSFPLSRIRTCASLSALFRISFNMCYMLHSLRILHSNGIHSIQPKSLSFQYDYWIFAASLSLSDLLFTCRQVC